MDEDAGLAQEVDGEVFVGLGDGDAEDGVPSAFDGEPLTGFLLRELAVEFGEIGADAVEQLGLDAAGADRSMSDAASCTGAFSER